MRSSIIVLAGSRCARAGCGGGSGIDRRRQGPAALRPVGHQPEARLSEVRGRVPESRTRTSRSRSRTRTGATTGAGSRAASSPRPRRTCSPTTWQVPAVRAERGDRAGQHERRRHEPVPARPRAAVEDADRQAVRLPKDWDTVAIVVNQDMLKAGVTKQQLDNATWNPKDGGTFEQIAAKLSVDKNGKRGDEPGFDPGNVKTYGLGLDPGGFTYGQTTWAGFARQPRLPAARQEPLGHEVQLRRPALRPDHHLVAHMIEKGYMPTLAQARTLGQLAAFQAAGPRWTSTATGRSAPTRPPRASSRLLAAARGPAGQLEHVQRPRRRDLGRHQAQARGAQVGALPRQQGVPEHRRHRGRRVPGDRARGAQGGRQAQEGGRRRQRVHLLHQVRPHGALPDHREGAADQPGRPADDRGDPQRRRGPPRRRCRR